jgi:drug/metabolite transporter (DMT)-like permease
MTPLMGIAAGAVFLGEKLQPNFIIGSALILAGLLLTRLGQKTSRLREASFDKKESHCES